ncbi:site-2 protease family protein [Synechococcus sp. PCC 7336]|uniref:site-2 protease family protein n=1 Tax=Synechococcus sp. PCC 7336 TaxID=195250 RepID=UPI000346B42B|nr:site-2 protease family protein [Synechococcus sp. PCC 7336]
MRGEPFLLTLVENPTHFFQWAIIIVVSICLHELGHGLAAIYEGDDTPIRMGHMTWNPVVHMGVQSLVFLLVAGIAWGAMPVNPSKFRSAYGDVIVSAAGPATNLAIALVCAFIVNLALAFGYPNALVPTLNFLAFAAQVNIVLCLFNLLPIPPLDGYHVFSKFFPELRSIEGTPFAFAALFILFFTGLFSGLWDLADWVIRLLINT